LHQFGIQTKTLVFLHVSKQPMLAFPAVSWVTATGAVSGHPFQWDILWRWSLKVSWNAPFTLRPWEFGVYKCCIHAHPSLSLKKPDLAQVNTERDARETMCRAQGLILINPLWPTLSSYTVCVRKRECEPGHHVLLWVGRCLGIVSIYVCVWGPAVPGLH